MHIRTWRFVILLRGINVGGHNILPMKELTDLLVGFGCSNVKTYIQSGNVVLDSKLSSAALSKKVTEEIKNLKSFEVNALVLSQSEFKKAVTEVPFKVDDGKQVHLFFLLNAPTNPNMSILESCKSNSEVYELIGRVLYLYAPDGIGRSKSASKVDKAMGVPVTARNMNTVQKLADLICL